MAAVAVSRKVTSNASKALGDLRTQINGFERIHAQNAEVLKRSAKTLKRIDAAIERREN
jgi:hypothetical protein